MLFRLDKSLSALLCQSWSGQSALYARVLERLLIAHADGLHLFLIDPDIAKSLDCELLSDRARATARRIALEFPTLASITTTITRSIAVFPNGWPTTKQSLGPKIHWEVGINLLDNATTLRESAAIAEDTTDLDIIALIAQGLLKKGDHRMRVKMERHHGGGDRINSSIWERRLDKRLIVVLVDSDIEHPHDQLGETCQKAHKALNGYSLPNELLVLPVREIENIIPVLAFKCLFELDPNFQLRLNTYEAMFQNGFWKYLDLKDGSSCDQLRLVVQEGSAWCPQKVILGSSCMCSDTEPRPCGSSRAVGNSAQEQ